MRHLPVLRATLALSSIASQLDPQRKFDHDACLARVLQLQNGTISPNDTSIFALDPFSGTILSGQDDMELTLEACRVFCGPQGFYSDAGPRFMTWILPILLLLSNIELSPIDKRRFTSLFQAMGDPTDAIWSLIHKLQTWTRLYDLSGEAYDYSAADEEFRRNVATVFSGFEEIFGSEVQSDEFYLEIARELGVNELSKRNHWRQAARQLADSRTDEFFRTWLAIILYILAYFSAFLPSIGGGFVNPPGGVIGCGVLLSFLVPVALLSNTIGGFTSRRTCIEIMMRFVGSVTASEEVLPIDITRAEILVDRVDWNDYFHRLLWSGASYTFRPWKTKSPTTDNKIPAPRPIYTCLLSTLPVIVGFTSAFIIIWEADPPGFSCRHLWLTPMFVCWILSALISWASHKHCSAQVHWKLVLIKDVIIGVPSLVVIILSAVGWFNSCECWGRAVVLGDSATVPMNVDARYGSLFRNIFPGTVGVCVFFQLAFYFYVFAQNWRGIRVMRWRERHRLEAWIAIQGRLVYTQSTYWLFWKKR